MAEFPKTLSREDRRQIRRDLDVISGMTNKKTRHAAYRLLVAGMLSLLPVHM